MTLYSFDYGQFGEPSYHPDCERWTAQRSSSASGALSLFEHRASSGRNTAGATSKIVRSSHGAALFREISRAHPAIQPATFLLPNLLRESTTRSDKWKVPGDQLAVVRLKQARSLLTSGENQDSLVLITPGGLFGQELRFRELRVSQLGWNSVKDSWLEAIEISEEDSGGWDGDSLPVLQISTPNVSDNGLKESENTVVVRTQTSICIVSIDFRRDDTVQSHDGLGPVQSRICSKTVMRLKMPSGHTVNWSDCTFNAWDSSKIAAVDTTGRWIVWGIRSFKNAIADVLIESQMTSVSEELKVRSHEDHHFAWHRIFWILDVHHVLLCNRHQVCLFDIFNISAEVLVQWTISEPSSTAIILDCRQSPSSDNHIFVLTTSHIMLLRMHTENASAAIETISSWQHHRDHSDVSMKLALYNAPNGELIICRLGLQK